MTIVESFAKAYGSYRMTQVHVYVETAGNKSSTVGEQFKKVTNEVYKEMVV